MHFKQNGEEQEAVFLVFSLLYADSGLTGHIRHGSANLVSLGTIRLRGDVGHI